MSEDIVIREAQRELSCRGCDKQVTRGEPVIYTYSFRNRGQSIYFCMDCVERISQL